MTDELVRCDRASCPGHKPGDCPGHKKPARGGGPCSLKAGTGTDHLGYGLCKFHGGSSPGGKTHAVKDAANQELRKLVAANDLPPIENPLTELARITAQVVAFKDAIGERVNELVHLRYVDDKGGEQMRSEVGILERAFDRCEKFLTAMARLKIDERLAAIQESQVDLLMTHLDAALTKAGVPAEQAAEVKLALADSLSTTTG